MTTLEELLESRGHKFDKEIHCSCSDWWKGYMTGWHNAYHDIREILEYNGFDMSIIAIPEVIPCNIPRSMEENYILDPCWEIRADGSLRLREVSIIPNPMKGENK